MTTIAYKNGVIAYDSRRTCDGRIVTDRADKKRERDGHVFFGSGSTSDILSLMDAFFGAKIEGECDAQVIVVHDGHVTEIIWTEGRLFKYPVDHEYAIGSGSDNAITAMDMGATAAEAVEMAMKRDTATGGQVRTLLVRGGNTDDSPPSSQCTA
jgi:20S proteasome alpha/beta subunit